MVEGEGGTTFPVKFFDGEREMNIGNVKIEAKQVYKSFQFVLAHKIGISPNQISIYLVDRNNSKFPENRRKFPITAKANFAQICQERDCCILVVLKRSRKARTRKGATPLNDFTVSLPRLMPENVIILRRHQQMEPPTFYGQIAAQDLDCLNERLQRGNNYSVPHDAFPRTEEAFPMMMMKENQIQRYFCEECTIAKKNRETPDFHHCVNDVVVKEFRAAAAGPIGPLRW